jgi:quercetin dioxygenase-like cupin family protein
MKHLIGMLSAVPIMSLAILGSQDVNAQQRTVLSRTDLSDTPDKEGVMLSVVIPPGLSGAKHFHPGDEFLYVVEGALTIEIDGKAPVSLMPGQTIHIPGKAIHRALNPNANAPARVLTFGVFQKGQPDTTPVK